MEHGNDRPHCRWRLTSRSTGLSTVAGLRKLVTADDDPDLTYEIKISISFNVPAASIVEDAPTVTIFVENNQLTVS